MDKNELLALADRVEALTRPDREVDALIWWGVGGGKEHWPHYADMPAVEAVARVWGRNPTEPITFGNTFFAGPSYTASLDAAMSLVPEGFDWIVGHTNGGLTIYAECGGTGGDYTRFAATPALALTAAALRALAEQQP